MTVLDLMRLVEARGTEDRGRPSNVLDLGAELAAIEAEAAAANAESNHESSLDSAPR